MDFRHSYTVLLLYCLSLKWSLGFPVVIKSAERKDIEPLEYESSKELSPNTSLHSELEEFKILGGNISLDNDGSNISESEEYSTVLKQKENVRNESDVNVDGMGIDVSESLKTPSVKLPENRKAAETNNYVSHMIPNQGFHNQGYDSHTGGEVVVQKFGNTPEDQGKVVYIPVYDSPNHHGHSVNVHNAHNKAAKNPQLNSNKKTVGYIGVVFVHKMKPEDAITASNMHPKGNSHSGLPHSFRDQSHGSNHKSSHSNSFTQQLGNGNLDDEDYRLLQQAEIIRPKLQWQSEKPPTYNTNSNTKWKKQNTSPGNMQWQNNPASNPAHAQWQNHQTLDPGHVQWQNHQTLDPGQVQWQNQKDSAPVSIQWQSHQAINSGKTQWQNPHVNNAGHVQQQNINSFNPSNGQFPPNNLKQNYQKSTNSGNPPWQNQKSVNTGNLQWKNQQPSNPDNTQWQNQNVVAEGNGWTFNPITKTITQIPIQNGQTPANQRPWMKNQNIHSGQNVFDNQNQGIIYKGNSNMNSNNQHNFKNTKPTSENPLFPTRGNSQKSQAANKNGNGDSFHEKKIVEENIRWIDESGKLNNYPQNQQHNFNTNNIPISHAIPETDNKGSVQYIPVIKHVVIEKTSGNHNNHLQYNKNRGGAVHAGVNQNDHHFNQLPEISQNSVISDYDHNNGYNDKRNNINFNAITPQLWDTQAQNMINQSPDLQFLQPPNHFINQYKRNGMIPLDEHTQVNSKTRNQNSGYFKSSPKQNQRNLNSNKNLNNAMFENIPSIIAGKNIQLDNSDQAKFIHQDNPITQEFSKDPHITEAFRVAGIYLQNKNVPSNSEDTTNSHNSFHTPNPNVQYHNDGIKATTDQRYNALVHEKNNNLNVIQTKDNTKKPSYPNFVHPFEQASNGISNGNLNELIYQSPQINIANLDNRFSGDANSYELSNAIGSPQVSVNQNKVNNKHQFFNVDKNEETQVFTGFEQKDNAEIGNGHVQYSERSNQRNYENNPIVSNQGSPDSVNDGIPNSNKFQNEASKSWNQRHFKKPKNYSVQINGGKIKNPNISNINNADGADSNGFGGESFW